MATISKYQNASGATLYRVRYKNPQTGRFTDKRGFTTKRDANAYAVNVEHDKSRGKFVAASNGKVAFGEYAQQWLDSKYNLKPSTRARYEITLSVALAKYHHVPIGEISRPMVRALVSELAGSGASASSVHKAVGLLRSVLALAVDDNLLAVNPAVGVDLPPVQMTEQRFLTTAELHRLALASGSQKTLIYVLGTTGLRFGEAAELRWKDVDLNNLRLRVTRSVTFVNGRATVGTPKNGKPRSVALTASVAEMLTPGKSDALVFPDSSGGWMRASNVRRRWWADALIDAGLPNDFKLHELRHTAASLAIRSGANLKALQNMLGHASASLTMDRYGHLYDADIDAVGRAIDAELSRDFGQISVTDTATVRHLRAVSGSDLQ